MEIEITDRKTNQVLDRDEIQFTVVHKGEATPPLEEVRKLLKAELNSKDELTIVDGIHSDFGWGVSKGSAKVYKDEDQIKRIEPQYRLNKNLKKPAEESQEGE